MGSVVANAGVGELSPGCLSLRERRRCAAARKAANVLHNSNSSHPPFGNCAQRPVDPQRAAHRLRLGSSRRSLADSFNAEPSTDELNRQTRARPPTFRRLSLAPSLRRSVSPSLHPSLAPSLPRSIPPSLPLSTSPDREIYEMSSMRFLGQHLRSPSGGFARARENAVGDAIACACQIVKDPPPALSADCPSAMLPAKLAESQRNHAYRATAMPKVNKVSLATG